MTISNVEGEGVDGAIERRGGNFLVVVDTVCRFERVEDWVGWVSTTRVLELSDLIDAAVTDKWMVFQLTLQAKVCMEHV